MTKVARISSYSDCAKCRLLIEQGKATLAWRKTDRGRDLILKTASGAMQAVIDQKFESEFSQYAGRWSAQ